MAPQELEGATLGEKHRSYNKMLQESQLSVADTGESDIENLLKIDIACQNKNVDYILNVIKGEDMLYVTRALTRCTWLYTDNEYANIVNPDYLQSEIFPNMNTKSIIMFKKQIRRNIRDESRAEQFYLKETDKSEACKWLPYCSVAFIENNIEQYVKPSGLSKLKLRLFKRLCEKSITIFEIMMKHAASYEGSHYLKVVTFLLNTNTEKYMDVLESSKCQYPKLNHKSTDLIMKHSKTRVIEKIDDYITVIHIPTFVKYLEVNEIKTFLTVQAKKKVESFQYRGLRRLFQYDTLKYFIYRLPKEEQFDFVKKVCMRRENEIVEKEESNMDTDTVALREIICNNNHKWYDWYQFAEFDHAFDELTKLISQNVESREKLALLTVLVKCAKQNLEHIQTILNYYIKKHINEDESSKIQFVTEIIKHTDVSKYDEKTWSMLNKVFKFRNINEASPVAFSCNTPVLNFIIIYNALNDQETPEVIKKQFMFNTLKSYNTKMNQAQKDKVFNYLYELSKSKMNSPVTTETEFTESIKTLNNILHLLKDWNKQLVEYPLILNRIKELIKLKKEHSYKASLSKLYNFNKSWRKHMFEESISLNPCEEVCLNALKHEPQLFVRHNEEMGIIKKNDTISLKRFLSKLRIYWPQSLAQEWIEVYFNNINDTNGQKAAVRGIVTMLPQKPLLSMIEKYQPVQPKIDWKQADDSVISVQRLIAKNMHRARPQPTPDAILGYAKGDYLQFALPSLLAIFYNVKFPLVRQYIPKLLDSPVSLQKHGIRLAFKKLDREELKSLFLNCWKSSKNATIRSIIFKYTHTLLCNEKEATNSASLWELLEIFIDNLTFTEDKDIYKLFAEVSQVPINIRAKYLIKGYNFLQKLIPTLEENDRPHYEWITSQLAAHSRIVMETISPDFVISLIQEYLDKKFFNCNDKYATYIYHSDDGVRIITAYLLCSKDENEQIQKYHNVFVPLMRRSLEKWGEKSNGKYFVRKHFYQLLTRLCYDLKDYVEDKNMLIPLKMFTLILDELEKNLPITENYIILTKWKLTVAFAKLTQEHSSTKDNTSIFPEFGKICLENLKKDVEVHFPCIYVLFCKCVKQFLFMITPQNAKLEFYEGMLSDKDFVQGYLAVIEIALDSRGDVIYKPLWKQIASHPSVEVKMHYYNKIDEKEKESNYAI